MRAPQLFSYALAFLLLLSACGTTSSNVHEAPAEEFIEVDKFDDAVMQASVDFPEPLPAGIDWPSIGIDFKDPLVNPDQQRIVIGEGYQDTYISGYWLCAWMDVYLEAMKTGDGAGQQEGIDNISKYTSLPSQQEHLQNPEEFDSQLVAPAALGDPTVLKSYYGSSCGNYVENNPKAP